jgi:hypothetical protein
MYANLVAGVIGLRSKHADGHHNATRPYTSLILPLALLFPDRAQMSK